jgi:hypothetical protein
MSNELFYPILEPRLEPRLARIYYHELNVFNNQGNPGVHKINQPVQQELVQDNIVETNMYNTNSLIDKIDREEFINYITDILTTNKYGFVRKLGETQSDAKPYNELITKDDSDKIIEEVERINDIAEQKQELADSVSHDDDDDTAADNAANAARNAAKNVANDAANIGGTKHNKSRRRHKKSKYNKTTRGRNKSRRRRRHKKSTHRRRHKH